MTEIKKSFSIRRFVSVATLCLFIITAFSGILLLTSHGKITEGASGYGINWKGLHETGCVFFLFFGVWHFILNLKVMCGYFTDKDTGKIAFRMDCFLPVILAAVLFTVACLLPGGEHESRGYRSPGHNMTLKSHSH